LRQWSVEGGGESSCLSHSDDTGIGYSSGRVGSAFDGLGHHHEDGEVVGANLCSESDACGKREETASALSLIAS
jgi:hypothetical protein